MQDACNAFHDMVYAVEEGVQGFYDALLDHAQNMAMFPDEFTSHEQFLKGIPSDMLVALVCNGRLAPKVNTVEEFVSEAKAYKSSIKTAVHYPEHSKKSWLQQQLLLATVQSLAIRTALAKQTEAGHFAHECRKPAKPAPQVFVQAAHTAAPSDVGEANDEQEEEPAKDNTDDAFESNRTQEHGEEYIELETYDNNYYTCGSDSEGLFALTEAPIGKHREKEPSNKVCMRKVWLVASKDIMECPVLPAQDKECLVTWVEVNGH
ncbi:hypothetical protein C0989_011291 [Termitomyces sp. Mn162]|nr:hypothetical protein C0989_011291 [Termitomyces sp. Mn162]